ncbi:MAG TPA: MipA/OmpV family protein [Telmatospirillum sp.]|nr:MipA/OmpV family protein [Telmatospirillum sp.]
MQSSTTSRLAFPLICFGLLFSSTAAKADENLDRQLEQPGAGDHPSTWDVTLGIGAGYAPRFEGAERYHVTPIPFGSVSYRGWASLGPQGLGADVVRAGKFKMGVLAGYAGGRDENDDPHLHGLGNISGSLQLGGYAAYQWDAFEVRAQVRQAVIHTGNGLTGSLGATYAFRPAPRWMLKLGPQLSFADSDHMRKFFGVTAGQSASSGLRVYTADGGLQDVALGLNATYRLSDHWLVFGIAKVSEIIGNAADSPIVQSKEQAFGGMGIAYHF